MASNADFQIAIEGVGEKIPCPRDRSVLVAMEARGLARIPVGCRGGGCGICKIRVVSGDYRTGRMAACHVTEEERRQGYVLACRLYPNSDLIIRLRTKNRGVITPALLGKHGTGNVS
tara:strand:- start:3295 stop:3645 length:351 start_codon:yes stop_codon:yes gene_type:complete